MQIKRLLKLTLLAVGIFTVGFVLVLIFILPKQNFVPCDESFCKTIEDPIGVFQTPIYTTSTKLEISNLSYSSVVSDKTKSYVGKQVAWKGKIATNLSQIDGIKFWVVDKQHQPNTKTNNAWFWSVPADWPTSDDTNGAWVTYMLKRYGNIDASKINPDSDVFLITGKFLELDCTFYDNGPCIPNLEVEKIERL